MTDLPKVRGCCGTWARPATAHKEGCPHEKVRLAVQASRARWKKHGPRRRDLAPDWMTGCENCGQKPIVPITGMCGPCTFGEAETIDGNW